MKKSLAVLALFMAVASITYGQNPDPNIGCKADPGNPGCFICRGKDGPFPYCPNVAAKQELTFTLDSVDTPINELFIVSTDQKSAQDKQAADQTKDCSTK
jgi:hypothetical protein